MRVSTTVSVALCTHNGMPYVREQVASILAQSVSPRQLVLSDDASTDATVATVRELVEAHNRARPDRAIELEVLENAVPLRVVRNFEQAVGACTGDLIVLCDQDDVWHPERIAIAQRAFELRPELTLVHANARLVDGDGAPLGYTLFDGIALTEVEKAEIHAGREFDALLRRNLVTGATTMFRRELLDVAVPFPEPWVHDEWLAMLASILGTTDLLDDELIDYRQHGANQIGARKRSFGEKIGELLGSRTERSAYLVARAEVLLARLEALGERVPPVAVALAAEKVAHERRRRDLPRLRVARLRGVIAEYHRGEYGRFGRPRYDILRDLFQPGA
jgi:glycosyltransferase involved in cell wall biosynthesis